MMVKCQKTRKCGKRKKKKERMKERKIEKQKLRERQINRQRGKKAKRQTYGCTDRKTHGHKAKK